MSRLGDLYLNALDLFSALLPGAIALGAGVALRVTTGWPEALAPLSLTSEGERTAAFVAAAYLVGQVASALGALLLDRVFNRLYEPGKGLLSPPDARPRGLVQRGLKALFGDAWEGGTAQRVDHLRRLVGADGGDVLAAGATEYMAARVYLRLRVPQAAEELERLEAQQKFFRSLVVVALGLAVMTRVDGSALALDGIALLCFVRYVSVRRKTVRMAYVYFAARVWCAPPAKAPEPTP